MAREALPSGESPDHAPHSSAPADSTRPRATGWPMALLLRSTKDPKDWEFSPTRRARSRAPAAAGLVHAELAPATDRDIWKNRPRRRGRDANARSGSSWRWGT